MDICRGQRLPLASLLDNCAQNFQVESSINGLLIDFACFGLDANSKLLNDDYMVFFNQPQTPCGSIAISLQSNSAIFSCDLNKLPVSIERLVFTAAIDGLQTMSQMQSGYLKFLTENQEAANFKFHSDDFEHERSLILGEIYRKNGNWRFHAAGQGFNEGLEKLVEYFGSVVITGDKQNAPTPKNTSTANNKAHTDFSVKESATNNAKVDSVSQKPFELDLPQFDAQLKSMTNLTLDLLSKEATRLLDLQIETLTEALPSSTESSENKVFSDWISNLHNERQKLAKLEMVLAVIGTMKAGKSTTINAIVGMEVLPNRETAMTTLPTLIRHIHGQKHPVLKIKKNQPLRELSQAVAKKLQGLSDVEKNKIDLQGVEDGKNLITQLVKQQGYPFATEYTGQDAIFEFLKHLNDIMRLAKDEVIGIDPPYAEYENADDLPVIEVEFCHLKNNQNVAQGSLAILDTPGPNEFGQSAALRKVFKTQLEKASAVLLVTDFTQMKTEADQNVRSQIMQIESTLPKGSLYVVVNKFDQRNKNSMSKDEVKDYVANGLMNGKVDTTQVFPVSSYLAYLASRAKSYLEQHDRLPTPEQEPWLADFADKAFGTGWEDDEEEEDIWAVAHVKEHIIKLEKKSLFEEPIEKVIKEAHADAANRSFNSAITKLKEYNREFLTSLNISSEMMTKSILEIEKKRDTLQKDIDRCLKVSHDVKATAKVATGELSSELDAVMKEQSQEINKALDTFFNEGRAMEKASFDKKKQDELKKQSGSGIFSLLGFILGAPSTGREEQIFNPHSSRISCNSAYEAEELINKINKSVKNTFENADNALDIVTKELITTTSETISKQIDEAVKEVLASAKAALTGDDNKIDIKFELKPIRLEIGDVNTQDLMQAKQESTETETKHRRSSGVWGGVCSIFGTKDWGWEEYESTRKTYAVDIGKIRAIVSAKFTEQIKKLGNQTTAYLDDEFQPKIDEHLKQLVAYLERYRDVLNTSIKSSKLDEETKNKLIQQLLMQVRKQEVLQGDIVALDGEVSTLLGGK